MVICHFIPFLLFFFLQSNMPLRALYAMVLEHDIKVGNSASETVGLLQQKEFYQVLDFCGEQIASLENQAVAAAGALQKPNRSGAGEGEMEMHTRIKGEGSTLQGLFSMSCPHLPDTFSYLLRNLPS